MLLPHDPSVLPINQSQERILLSTATKPISYEESVSDPEHDHEHSFELGEALRIIFVFLAAGAVWLRLWEPYESISIIGMMGLLVGGWPIFKEAAVNIVSRRMTMELSMSL